MRRCRRDFWKAFGLILLCFSMVSIGLIIGRAGAEHFQLEVGASGGSSYTAKIYSAKDTYARDKTADSNFGSSTCMYVEAAPERIYAFIEFPLQSIPSTANIISARVYFFAGDTVGYPASQTFSRIVSSWGESTLTWNKQPTVTSLNEATVLVPWLNGGGYVNFDVTQLVKDALEGRAFGFRIKQVETKWANMFYSTKEARFVSWRPRLEVVYELPVVEYVLSISPGGSTDPALGAHSYAEGSIVRITAYPLSGYRFDHWELDGVLIYENPLDVLMDRNHSLNVIFTELES